MYKNQKYIHGSLAEKEDYSIRTSSDMKQKKQNLYRGQNEYDKQKANRQTTVQQNEKKDDENILYKEKTMRKSRNKVRRKYVLMIFVLFVFGVVLIFRYGMVIEMNSSINSQQIVLSKLRMTSNQLQKEISQEMDLEKIRQMAETKLNMQKPDNHQIIYIKVPRKDHALLEVDRKEKEKTEEGIGFLGQILLMKEKMISK